MQERGAKKTGDGAPIGAPPSGAKPGSTERRTQLRFSKHAANLVLIGSSVIMARL